MNRILNFRNFEKANYSREFKNSDVIQDYLLGKVTESQLEDYFLNELSVLNEGLISDTIKGIQDWFLDKCLKLYELVMTAGSKLIGLANSIINALKRFSKKYPLLCKIIIIFIVIAVILMVTAVQAKAQVSGNPPNENVINGAIGMLENAKRTYIDIKVDVTSATSPDLFKGAQRTDVLSEAQTYLLSMKAGKVSSDPSTFSEGAKHFADFAIKHVKEIVNQGTDEQKQALINLANKGAKLTSSSIEEIQNIAGSHKTIRQSWEGGNPFAAK